LLFLQKGVSLLGLISSVENVGLTIKMLGGSLWVGSGVPLKTQSDRDQRLLGQYYSFL